VDVKPGNFYKSPTKGGEEIRKTKHRLYNIGGGPELVSVAKKFYSACDAVDGSLLRN
jgi:hypothetical protein